MEPVDITIVAIQNPVAEEAIIDSPQRPVSPQSVIEQYGSQIEHGAFVALTDRSARGNTVAVEIFVADRQTDGGRLYLQNNEYMCEDDAASVDNIGSVVASGDVPIDPTIGVNPADLETFTVFGNNDNGVDFVAVVTATEDTVYDVGVQAGLIDEGFESSVSIACVLKGDQSGAERVSV